MNTASSVILAAVLIAGSVFWALDGVSEADPYRDVATVVDTPDEFSATPTSVKGRVVAGTIEHDGGLIRFALADESGDPARNGTTMQVRYAGVLPDAFGPKLVVVTGRVIASEAVPGDFVFEADAIQVGCSSKY